MALCHCLAVPVQHRKGFELDASHTSRLAPDGPHCVPAVAWRKWEPLQLKRSRAGRRDSLVAGGGNERKLVLCSSAAKDQEAPWRVMISGAPASGKGTQSELILQKFDLVHVAAGDLLRAEVAAGTASGKVAKKYMNEGKLVPNEIVVTMVKNRLEQPDAVSKGWLLDGYPRSLSQAEALEKLNIKPQLFILLEVPDHILVERVVGRRMDPVTGKIYHLKFNPPENEEVAARLTQRFDDTEEKVRLRLETHHSNVAAVLSIYKDIIKRIDGTRPKSEVFADICTLLTELGSKSKAISSPAAAGGK